MNGAAIVAATDIDKRSVADRKRSAGDKWQRGLDCPAGSQLFVVIDFNAWWVVTAGRHDAGVVYRSSVEPQPAHVHGRPGAPTVGNRIVDLRGGDGRGEWCSASEQVEFPLVHRAARRCYWRRHDRPGCPTVGGGVVDVQRVHFGRAIVTAGNVELAVDDPEPGQVQRCRQGRAGSPAIAGDIVDVHAFVAPVPLNPPAT